MKIERVQMKFVKFLCIKSNIQYSSTQYANLCKEFSLPILTVRRQQADLCFLHKCLNNVYRCSHIIAELPFHVPSRRLRSHPYFRTTSCRVNMRKFSFIPRVCNLFNQIVQECSTIDFFRKFSNFKSNLLRHFNK